MMDARREEHPDRDPGAPHILMLLPDDFAISRMDGNAPIPSWARGSFVSITRSEEELSVVCPQRYVPAQVPSERDWRCLAFKGPIDFGMTGVVARLAGVLESRNVSLFVISTFDTDYVLIRQNQMEAACTSLIAAGYRINESPDSDVAIRRHAQ